MFIFFLLSPFGIVRTIACLYYIYPCTYLFIVYLFTYLFIIEVIQIPPFFFLFFGGGGGGGGAGNCYTVKPLHSLQAIVSYRIARWTVGISLSHPRI